MLKPSRFVWALPPAMAATVPSVPSRAPAEEMEPTQLSLVTPQYWYSKAARTKALAGMHFKA